VYASFNIDDFDQYCTTKTKVAEIFGLSRRTIQNYSAIASKLIGDFDADYPNIDGKVLSSAGLSLYQCWVLYGFHLWLNIRKLPLAVLKHKLTDDVDFYKKFSKKRFEKIYGGSEINNNEPKSVCRIA
jgi:hypothetical protein